VTKWLVRFARQRLVPGAQIHHEGTLGAVRHPDAIGITVVILLKPALRIGVPDKPSHPAMPLSYG